MKNKILFIIFGMILLVSIISFASATRWNLSTAVYDSNFTLTGGLVSAQDLFFKPDGTAFYIIDQLNAGAGANKVFRYNLSTAWNISTAVYNSNFTNATPLNDGKGLFFKPDGTNMYILNTGGTVEQYILSSAWNISTASFSKGFTNITLFPENSLSFKDDGTKMYWDGVANVVRQFSLSPAWDTSTAVADNKEASLSELSFGLFIKPDGLRFYSAKIGAVKQYNLATAWDISTYSSTSFTFSSVTPVGVFFSPDGNYAYVIDNTYIYKYVMPIMVINQTNNFTDINMPYNSNAFLTFAAQNYFNSNATSILLQFINPDTNISENISVTNPIQQNTAFSLNIIGDISNILTVQIVSEALNYNNYIIPYACNPDGCITGNQFLLTINSTTVTSPTILSTASNGLLGIFPSADSLTLVQKIAMTFLILFAVDLLLLILTLVIGKGEGLSVLLWFIAIIDLFLIILFTAMDYFPLALLIGFVAIGIILIFVKGKSNGGNK